MGLIILACSLIILKTIDLGETRLFSGSVNVWHAGKGILLVEQIIWPGNIFI